MLRGEKEVGESGRSIVLLEQESKRPEKQTGNQIIQRGLPYIKDFGIYPKYDRKTLKGDDVQNSFFNIFY